MSDRAQRLYATADAQIGVLIDVISDADESVLCRPCPGREKLGDGTVGALAAHTAGNYGRIATFLAAGDDAPATSGDLLAQLSAVRDQLEQIAELSDRELDAVPPKDSFRFCDGQRTLEQVVTGLLKHQGHQVQALTAAITSRP